MNKILIVLVVILILAAGGVFLWQNFGSQNEEPTPIFCAADAKLCSDGSYVSRVAPSCEFTACPLPTGWKIYRDPAGVFEFQYPEKLTTKYIDAFLWPPTVTITDGEFSCEKVNLGDGPPERMIPRMVDGRQYCVTDASEGAAGSTYTTYTYTTSREGNLISLNFVLRYPQCLNYDDSQKSECLAERETFDLDGVIDRIVGTTVIE
jgi:hypothetical protein